MVVVQLLQPAKLVLQAEIITQNAAAQEVNLKLIRIQPARFAIINVLPA